MLFATIAVAGRMNVNVSNADGSPLAVHQERPDQGKKNLPEFIDPPFRKQRSRSLKHRAEQFSTTKGEGREDD